MPGALPRKPGLISVIFLSVGTMIGSGWLFAAYYAAQEAGGASLLSWIIGACLVVLMALLLSEIAIRYPINGLFTRLTTLSHNEHFGFVAAISNWLLGLIIIPSEAIASTQYLSTLYAPAAPYLINNGNITNLGLVLVALFVLFYFVINYWGIHLLSRVNNLITAIKLVVPLFTCVVFFAAAFEPHNFVAYQNSLVPYGIGSVFSAIVSCGIFYSFFGFQMAASFSAELENPKRNIPIALISSVLIVLVIYLCLQVSFIGAVPADMVANGWANLHFDSPLAQLAALLGINFLGIVLYVDAFISPSGTGLVYLGASARMLNEMVKHHQLPEIAGSRDPGTQFSRRSLVMTVGCALLLVLFFRNWQLIASLASTFIVISCIALPIAYARMCQTRGWLPVRILPGGRYVAIFVFLFLSYFLLLCGFRNILVAVLLHFIFFISYAFSARPSAKLAMTITALKSAWTMFAYLLFVAAFAWAGKYVPENVPFYEILFIIVTLVFYPLLVNQQRHDHQD